MGQRFISRNSLIKSAFFLTNSSEYSKAPQTQFQELRADSLLAHLVQLISLNSVTHDLNDLIGEFNEETKRNFDGRHSAQRAK